MKTPLILILLLFSFMFFACKKDENLAENLKFLDHFDISNKDTLETESGLKYLKVKEGSGFQAKNGLFVTVKYTGYIEKDSTVFDSQESFEFQLGTGRLIKGWQEGLLLMKAGDKYKIIIPSNLAFGNQSYYNIPANSDLVFDVELINVQQNPDLENEIKSLMVFVDSLKITEKPTINGLYYIEDKKGYGNIAEPGKTVRVNYTGKLLLTGKIFDTNIDSIAKKANIYQSGKSYEPFQFMVNDTRLIQGWNDGIQFMKEGGKARFIVPSYLAYGTSQNIALIPPYSSLLFEVELLSVQK